MDRKSQDCYFYFYSTCTKGEHCGFRHEPSALGCETMCPYWQQGKCVNQHCHLRHMELKKNRKSIPCYWETQPGGCRKPHCPFMHKSGRDLRQIEEKKERDQVAPVVPQAPADWARASYEHAQGHMQVASDTTRRVPGAEPAYVAAPGVADPLVVTFEDGMRLY